MKSQSQPPSKKHNSSYRPSLNAVLLDECLSEHLRHHLPGHECQTVRYADFAGLENGELLKKAEAAQFCGKSVLLEDLLPLMGDCLDHLKSIRPGQVVRIGD